MSFIGQSIKNKFPSWSKIRRDDSSNLSIILDCVGEELELLRRNGYALSLQQKNLLSTPRYEPEKMFKFPFRGDPNYNVENSLKRISSISLRTVSGVGINVFSNWNKYSYRYPSSFKVKDESLNIFSINLHENHKDEIILEEAKQLYINLENIKSFNNEEGVLGAGVVYAITIRGENFLDFPIEEQIFIKDLKIYKTNNYFKKIKSLERTNSYLNRDFIRGGDAIEIFGLDLYRSENALGEYDQENSSYITISECSFGVKRDQIKSDLSVSNNNPFVETVYSSESSAKNELFVEFYKRETEDNSEKSYLEFFHKYFRNENISLSSDSKISKEFFEESLCNFELADENGDSCDISDWSIDVKRSKIVSLGKDGIIRYHSIKKPMIQRYQLIEESKDLTIVLETNKRFYVLGEEIILNISLERPKGPIVEYCVIKGLDGDQEIYFLNGNNEWQEEVYLFEGNNFVNAFENIKPALFVRDTFENYGQINYYACSFRERIQETDVDKFFRIVNSKIYKDKKDVYSNRTSIVCTKHAAEKEIDISDIITDENAKISLQGLDNLIFIKDGERFFSLEEGKEDAFFSSAQEAIYLEKNYEEDLNLTIEYEDGTVYETSLNYGDN